MNLLKKLKYNLLPLNRRVLKKEVNGIIQEKFDMLFKKMSMQDSVWQIDDVKFFVPNYPLDAIQNIIVNTNGFYEHDILTDLNQFLPPDCVICDIGANIGNHTLYWLTKNKAEFVYCYEPRIETFEILQKNIGLNHLQEKTKCFNVALSDNVTKLSVQNFSEENIGANVYRKNEKGNTDAVPLDSISFDKKIDFIKIDVERMEVDVLSGAEHTIKTHLPVVFIEVVNENYQLVNEFFHKLGYSMIKKYPNSNYLYVR